MTSWLIFVGLLVLFVLCLWLFWRSDPSGVEQQRATREIGEAIGRELEPALRRVVAAAEKITERLP